MVSIRRSFNRRERALSRDKRVVLRSVVLRLTFDSKVKRESVFSAVSAARQAACFVASFVCFSLAKCTVATVAGSCAVSVNRRRLESNIKVVERKAICDREFVNANGGIVARDRGGQG